MMADQQRLPLKPFLLFILGLAAQTVWDAAVEATGKMSSGWTAADFAKAIGVVLWLTAVLCLGYLVVREEIKKRRKPAVAADASAHNQSVHALEQQPDALVGQPWTYAQAKEVLTLLNETRPDAPRGGSLTMQDGPAGAAQAYANMGKRGLPPKPTPAEVAAIDQRQSEAFGKNIEGMERVLAQYDHLITGDQDDSLCTIFKKCIPDASGGSMGWEAFWGEWAGRRHHERFKAKVAALRGRLVTPKDFEEAREAFESAMDAAFVLYQYLEVVSREGGSPSFVAQWEDFRAFMEGRGPFEGFLNFVANAREQNKRSKFEHVIFPAMWATKNQHGERYG